MRRGLDYWLPYAMNAVIGLVEGRPDPVAHDLARSLSPDADLFVVATCGALGHGAVVADLLPVVLVSDTELTEHQQRIWRAATTGVFGDLGDDLGEVWRPVLDREPVAGWSAWVTSHAASPSAGVSWLSALVTPPAPATMTVPVVEMRTGADTPLGHLPVERDEPTRGPATLRTARSARPSSCAPWPSSSSVAACRPRPTCCSGPVSSGP